MYFPSNVPNKAIFMTTKIQDLVNNPFKYKIQKVQINSELLNDFT